MTVTRPTNLQIPFANEGTKNTIPLNPSGKPGAASHTLGFPPVTMLGIVSGGIQPAGPDWNGILNYVTKHVLFRNLGGRYKFNQALCDAIGGYDIGMVVQSNDGLNEYCSLVNNNTTNFNTYPESIGVTWALSAGISSLGTPGTITICPTSTVPLGYLECDGSAVSRATYSGLFGVIGVKFGAGNGSTTFNLPDLRGYFPRGWSHGSTIDPDKASRTNRGDGTAGDAVGTKQLSQMASHYHSYIFFPSYPGSGSSVRSQYTTSAAPSTYLSSYYGVGDTRPININVMPVIKY